MKHVFIVNPMAGRHSSYDWVRAQAEAWFPSHGEAYSILVTRAPLHAVEIAREIAHKGDPVRFYSVGGDGTLNEVMRGALGFENAEVACVPAGSGNDYIKNFGSFAEFRDIPSQSQGVAIPVDLVRCGERLSCNICSVGFDAEVAYHLGLFKRLPLFTGSTAYLASMFYCLIRKVKNHFTVQVDEQAEIQGAYTLISCPNGVCYGGGFRPLPMASVTDGKIEFLLAKSISRLRFLHLVGNYKKGTVEKIPNVVTRVPGSHIHITSDHPFAVNLDGECYTETDLTFEIMPGAGRFVLPRRVAFPRG